MSNVTLTFKCGHAEAYPRAEMPATATCKTCGERVVVRVTGATPTFKGACTGPLVVKA